MRSGVTEREGLLTEEVGEGEAGRKSMEASARSVEGRGEGGPRGEVGARSPWGEPAGEASGTS